jgi:hypothetical protein
VTTAAPSRREYGSLSRFWRFVFIVGIFLLAWPPICGVVVWWIKFDNATPPLGWLAAAVIYAYLFCSPSALLAGIIHAVAAFCFRYNSVLVPVVSAVAAAVLMVALIVLPIFSQGLAYDKIANGFVVLLPLSLIASLMCWRLTRQFARMA